MAAVVAVTTLTIVVSAIMSVQMSILPNAFSILACFKLPIVDIWMSVILTVKMTMTMTIVSSRGGGGGRGLGVVSEGRV